MELKEIVDHVYQCATTAQRQFAQGTEEPCRKNLEAIKQLLNEELVVEDETPETDETPEKTEAAAGPEKTVSQEDKLD